LYSPLWTLYVKTAAEKASPLLYSTNDFGFPGGVKKRIGDEDESKINSNIVLLFHDPAGKKELLIEKERLCTTDVQ